MPVLRYAPERARGVREQGGRSPRRFGRAPSGARGCVDLRLRRVGATSHDEPADENGGPAAQPQTITARGVSRVPRTGAATPPPRDTDPSAPPAPRPRAGS